MNKKTTKRLGMIVSAFTIGAAIGFMTLQINPVSPRPVSAIEPAAGAEKDIPVPGRPIFKKDESGKATTIIPYTPQANGRDGSPQTLKTELGMEVSPLCFEQLFGDDGPKGPMDVTTCEKISGYKNIQTGIDQGRYRSLYEFPSEPDMPAEKGFSSYEVLGDVKAGTAVETYNETGGTGRFSSLILVKLTGNMLTLVDQITGGDRCNGGLTEARIDNGKLIYSANITPGDFPVAAWGNDKGLKPYEDLEASAMSCFGTATYSDGELSKVTLEKDALRESGDWTSEYKYQKCFNKHFQKQIQTGETELDTVNFRKFMDDFLTDCKKS